MCCGWWKKCVYPLYEIPVSVYSSLARLIRGGSIRNVTLTVLDNKLNAEKAAIIYDMVSQSQLSGFTLINRATAVDMDQNEHSDFDRNMMPLKSLTNLIVDVRWENYGCY